MMRILFIVPASEKWGLPVVIFAVTMMIALMRVSCSVYMAINPIISFYR